MTTQEAPASIGMNLEEIDTPALLLDLDAFERNTTRMADNVKQSGLKLRPHAKTHKCPSVAMRQIEKGAVGVCCQKVGEAEAMVNGGVRDVYISNEIVGKSKWWRMAALARQARVATCVDDPSQIAGLSAAANEFGVQLDVLVELNVGANRCGVEAGQPVLQLARLIEKAPGLHFKGIQAYQGAAQHLRTHAERMAAIEEATRRVVQSQDLLKSQGIPCEMVTGAGTGTYHLELSGGVYNEIQVGSYAFMDTDYAKNLDESGQPVSEFEHSLFVYVTVMSRPVPERAIVDAGHKALTVESGMPWVHGLEGVEFVRAADEHGVLHIKDPSVSLSVGDKLKLVPGHCDPAINLHDWFVGIRENRVEALWPITARGAVR